MFFFNDTATTEIYTLSLHDALPICRRLRRSIAGSCSTSGPEAERPTNDLRTPRNCGRAGRQHREPSPMRVDRKSTRLNSSHANISYAVFCLKKKKPHVCLL